jgi:hypothetical protein
MPVLDIVRSALIESLNVREIGVLAAIAPLQPPGIQRCAQFKMAFGNLTKGRGITTTWSPAEQEIH